MTSAIAARPAKSDFMPGSIGLIAAGAVSQSFLARVQVVRDRLGPVYSPALRIASRIVNGLRVGFPVADLEAFSRCAIVLTSVPDDMLDSMIQTATAAKVRWQRKTVVLCDSSRDSSALEPLQKLGGFCASLDAIPATGETRFVAEGDVAAIAELRRLVGRKNLLVLDRGGKAAYQAGLLLATDLAIGLTAAAVESLRAAGLKRPEAVPVIEALVTHAARSYAKAGRRAAAGLPPEKTLARYLDALLTCDPQLARLFESALSMQTIWQEKREEN